MVYILLAVLIVLTLLLKSPKVIGMMGEASVKQKLAKLDPKIYKVLHDVMIKQPDGKTSQIDHLVISPYGVFVIETKNYKGWIIGSEHSQYWTQVIYKRKEKLYNPIRQNYGHIKALEGYLEDSSVTFISIIVFGTRAELKLENMNTDVIRSPQLLSTIRKYQTIRLTDEKVADMHQKLATGVVHSHKERKQHVRDIKEKLAQDRKMADSGMCPRCKGQLVLRKGKNGMFKGCSNYPKCRYTSST